MSRATKYLIVTLLVTLIILLLRMKEVAPAGILSALLGVAALAERFLRLRMLYKAGQGSAAQKKEAMSYAEALELLGLQEHPTKMQVKVAYHRLMEKNHPDKGGSKVLAAQVNMARDVVLRELKKKG